MANIYKMVLSNIRIRECINSIQHIVILVFTIKEKTTTYNKF